MKTIIMGSNIQGLIAGAMMAREGIEVVIADFPNNDDAEIIDGVTVGAVTHIPFPLSNDIINTLSLDTHGLNAPLPPINPFAKLPFYDGLKTLVNIFQDLEANRPDFREKGWRDAWGTFEIGRILATYDADIQELFAKSATLSLMDLLDATELSDDDKGAIIKSCVMGGKTNPSSAGSAASILPAMAILESDNHTVFHGSLANLKTALTASAKQSGAKIIEGQYIHHLKTEGMEIQSVMMNGGEELTGDKFMLDHDPVWFFRDYLKGIKLSPAFKNRIIPKQNTKECARAVVALSSMPDQSIVDKLNTITGNDITTARNDLKKEGGAQMPVLSVVAITHNGVDMIDILAHYFDPTLEDTTPVIDAIKRALGADIESLITSITLQPTPSQCGNPNFISTMPLLQLFKIFFGHHSLAYDNPVQNLMICGYGNYAVSHPHVRRGGERVATLLQSL